VTTFRMSMYALLGLIMAAAFAASPASAATSNPVKHKPHVHHAVAHKPVHHQSSVHHVSHSTSHHTTHKVTAS
jgi:hypothetical protein